MSRLVAIEQCLYEALVGVNFGVGVGVIYSDRRQHIDCGSYTYTDTEANVGRRIMFGCTIKGGESKLNC